MSDFGHMNRAGARHVGEPRVMGGVDRAGRKACLYGAAMVAKHMPGFAAIAGEMEAWLRPPATILLSRPGAPDAVLTYEIPALLLPASVAPAPVQGELGRA